MILLVNPWVEDFAAYDLWAKPWGLIRIFSRLKAIGEDVRFIDLMYQHQRGTSGTVGLKRDGRAHYGKNRIPMPGPYVGMGIPRHFYRFGIEKTAARALLEDVHVPELILVTSGMTYWYRGIQSTIRFMNELYPGVPVMLGGIYATLCAEHAARHSGADRIYAGRDPAKIASLIGEYTGRTISVKTGPGSFPDLSMYENMKYAPLKMNSGCPCHCPYCASSVLEPVFAPGPDYDVYGYFEEQYGRGIRDFSFIDDALLVNREDVLFPFLEWVAKKGLRVRFHTPNAVHVDLFDDSCAALMKRAGDWTLRFGFESLDRRLEDKTDAESLERACGLLKKHGFDPDRVRIYLIAGLPGQDAAEVEESIRFVKSKGLRPVPNEYSPVPGSELFEKAAELSKYDVRHEPLFQNNTVVPCAWERQTYEDVQKLKALARS